jgi:hypothetical protein
MRSSRRRIIASWFGSKAGWRGQQFPVYVQQTAGS